MALTRELATSRLSLLLVLVALFTASWDRLGVVPIGTFSLKAPVVASALALAFHSYDVLSARVPPRGRGLWTPVTVAIFALVAATIAAVVMSTRPLTSAVQALTVVLGAVVPYLAVLGVVRDRDDLRRALGAFIYGGYLACIFGVYQLMAYYTGLPQFIEYRHLSGGLARIASFSYEAGYFGYFLILVVAAQVARSLLAGTRLRLLPVLVVIAVIALSNTRATLFTVPLVLVVLALGWPTSIPRPRLGAVAIVGVPWTVAGIAGAWPLVVRVVERALTVFDPTEASSNAPRLEVASAALTVINGSPLWGVGPGNFGAAAADYTQALAVDSNRAIVNNVWLQALVDGGPLLLVAHVALVVTAVVVVMRWRTPTARALMAGWLSVLLVCSWITSYFYDVKLWLVLGLAVAAACAGGKDEPPRPERQTIVSGNIARDVDAP